MADHNNRYRRGVGVMLLNGERKVWVGARVAGEEPWPSPLSPANRTTTASCGGWAVASVWVTRCEAVAMPPV